VAKANSLIDLTVDVVNWLSAERPDVSWSIENPWRSYLWMMDRMPPAREITAEDPPPELA